MSDQMGLPDLEFRPAIEFDYTFLADVFMRGFENYIVRMFFDAASLELRARAESWDLSTSFVAYHEGEFAGILFAARRGWSTRVAAMGVAATRRGRRVGNAMLSHCIAQARDRADVELLLEVIDSNAVAIRLYESVGLRKSRRLVGFECANPVITGETSDLIEIDPAEFAAIARREYEALLPWQMRAETLACLTKPNRAFSWQGRAFALLGDPTGERVSLRGLAVARADRRGRRGSSMLRALFAKFPGRAWMVGPIVPHGLADGFFLANGFAPMALGQWEMRLSLV